MDIIVIKTKIDQQILKDLTQHWFRTLVKFVADIRTTEMAVGGELYSDAEQLLMVANELNRAQNLINDPQEYKNCLERALELMDLFLADKSGSLLRETLRLRDIIAKSYIGEPDEVATIKNALLQMNPTAWTMLIKYSR